jgi:hypothetical protein
MNVINNINHNKTFHIKILKLKNIFVKYVINYLIISKINIIIKSHAKIHQL